MARRESFLTERQIQILRLRKEGHSQTEIARMLGTSRANISATEKVARGNIERARNTLDMLKMIEAPIWLSIEPGSDLNDSVKEIYHRADSEGIRVSHNFTSLASIIQEKAKKRVRGREVLTRLEVAIAKDGEIIVR
ncbi:MAG: Tfx family DNA-binding protein [Candidatus Hydrothermarchaeales archaeon]